MGGASPWPTPSSSAPSSSSTRVPSSGPRSPAANAAPFDTSSPARHSLPAPSSAKWAAAAQPLVQPDDDGDGSGSSFHSVVELAETGEANAFVARSAPAADRGRSR